MNRPAVPYAFHRRLLLFLMLALPVVPQATADDGAAAVFAELDALFSAARLDIKAPSLVYGVVAGGEAVHSGHFGQARLDPAAAPTDRTAYRIASMTKMMTALLVLDLQDQGLLHLDAPAEDYVPALADLDYPTRDSRRITVRDLLNHTAGFITDDPWADRQMARSREELDAFLARMEPFHFAPGEAFQYSNLGFTLLGRIIENVSGRSYAEQLQQRLLAPLGMTHTTLDLDDLPATQRAGAYNWVDGSYLDEPVLDSGAFDPLGGIWTTVEDYSRFVAWMLSAWPARDDPETTPIPRRVVRSVTDGVFLLGAGRGSGLNSADDCLMSSAYSMGLGIRRHCDAGLMLMHGGGFPGFGSYVILMPDIGIGVFAFANETYADAYGPVWDAARQLMSSDLARDVHRHTADPRLLSAYDGVFRAYTAGDITGADLAFADNFFLDRDRQRWNWQLAAIRDEAGSCEQGDLQARGRLSGDFTWTCETARVAGFLIQSPLDPAHLQRLHLRIVRRDGSGRDMVIDPDFH
jgi:CubicO group peptidase (beta-lactamase class C family)